jgi:hypothetical protein
MATLLGLGAIWATQRYNYNARSDITFIFLKILLKYCRTNNHALATDTEMGPLQDLAPIAADEDERDTSAPSFTHGASERRNNLHEVIGDALEVFSKHLRAHN